MNRNYLASKQRPKDSGKKDAGIALKCLAPSRTNKALVIQVRDHQGRNMAGKGVRCAARREVSQINPTGVP